MKKIFISYANEAMAYSLKHIGKQARRTGIFDEIILYTPADLPEYVKASPLMKYPRGAGYWCWKPAIITETLEKYNEGDIVVYVDAGCTVRKSPKRDYFFSLLEKYDTVCFEYADSQPQWKKWGADSSRIKYWSKASTLEFMSNLTGREDVGEMHQIMGGVLFMKGKDNSLLKNWKEIIFSHPELVLDPDEDELKMQASYYAGHRHDQTVLTPLANTDSSVKILPEESEAYSKDSFVWASRIRAKDFKEFASVQTKHHLRIWLGDERFEKLKKLVPGL